mgnify:CR=1 FL=1
MRISIYTLAILAAVVCSNGVNASDPVILASTTSTENSGFLDHILPIFSKATGIRVHVVVQGSGQALETGRRGDADILLIHAPEAERHFIEEGFGVKRFDVMHNDFVIVGPTDDPAHVQQTNDAPTGLGYIAAAEAPFLSRGDDSGTHIAERRLWSLAAIDPEGRWYREVGSGMGATLNAAAEISAYTITDRGTWLNFDNKRDLKILLEGDPELFNQYGLVLVSPIKHPHINYAGAQAFSDWMMSTDGQSAIYSFEIDNQKPFHPSSSGNG